MSKDNCCGGGAGKIEMQVNALQQSCPPAEPAECYPSTIGQPTNTPEKGDPLVQVESCDGKVTKVWIYTCDGGWQTLPVGLCNLLELNINNVVDVCNALKIPAFIDDPCCKEGFLTLQSLSEKIQECICANLEAGSPTTTALTCGSNGVFVESPIAFPQDSDTQNTTISDDDTVVVAPNPQPDGTTEYDLSVPCPPTAGEIDFTVQPNGTFLTDEPVWVCDPAQPNGRAKRPIRFPEIVIPEQECCESYQEESSATGGGVCFTLEGTTTANDPVIYQSRTDSIIYGSGSVVDAPNPPGMLTAMLTNPWTDPCVARVTLRAFGQRSLNSAILGTAFTFIISETQAEPYPVWADPISVFTPRNVSYTQLYPINNFEQDVQGIGAKELATNSSAPAVYSLELAAGQTKPVYSQFWVSAAPIAGATAPAGTTIGTLHGNMYIDVQYFRNGVLVNQEVL